MPPTTARWSILVVHGDGVPLGAFRRVGPRELRAQIPSRTTETVEDLGHCGLATNACAREGEGLRIEVCGKDHAGREKKECTCVHDDANLTRAVVGMFIRHLIGLHRSKVRALAEAIAKRSFERSPPPMGRRWTGAFPYISH